MIYSTETIQIMTNETKPKIKRSFKIAWEAAQELSQAEGQHLYGLDDIDEIFGELWEAIRQLRKENKKLKKVLEATEFAFKMKGWGALVSEHVSQLENMWKFDGECFLFTGGGNTPEPKPQAAAIFKCAKTHNPSKNGVYLLICNYHSRLTQRFTYWNGREWQDIGCHEEVLAFTETDPQEIINSLNK